ncbi:hypothetical protein HEP87_00100 [Streptomyces sp. S1D4-11]
MLSVHVVGASIHDRDGAERSLLWTRLNHPAFPTTVPTRSTAWTHAAVPTRASAPGDAPPTSGTTANRTCSSSRSPPAASAPRSPRTPPLLRMAGQRAPLSSSHPRSGQRRQSG